MSPMTIIIINLVIFIGIIFSVLFLFSKGIKRVGITSSVKNNSWILGGYIIILLFSMVIYFLMPEAEYLEWKGKAEDENGFLLYERLMNKEEIEESYLFSKETYDLSEKLLEIRSQDNYFQEYMIMYEKTPDLEGEIEVKLYKGILTVEQFDLSEELPLPSIKYSNGILEVEHPAYFEKSMAYTAPEFPFSQFSGQRSTMQGYGHSSSNAIIYVRVPEDIEVTWNEEFMIIPEVK
ncbi:hypothetical protein FZC76_00670 [Sutcliffiella horikoshii]|uniref:Uncharacterized protein n=1 Tax=Sutcliffiella horikoshii TaxID=79883 RepID=A0A5D4T8L6_9BACI|nr:hypothetical protein [Sutcliffiella horikoshii]TYS70444.1 hypothetical protein FZC76_00670 [Sutcliffiella horikoshii]